MVQAIPTDEIELYRERFILLRRYLTEGEKTRIQPLLRRTMVTGNADSYEWEHLKQTIHSAEERRARDVQEEKSVSGITERAYEKKKHYVCSRKTEQLLLLRRLTGRRAVHPRKKGV